MGKARRKPTMIQKVVKLKNLNENNSVIEDLEYWMSKTHNERLSTVEYLRRQYHGNTARLQRVARVIQRTQG